MVYTIQALSQLAGISTRTLRYYDEIGLLKPAYTTEAGYRMYEETQVNLLQEILFFRSLDFSLQKISQLIGHSNHNRLNILCEQRRLLLERKKTLDQMIETIEQTIQDEKGEIKMTDAQKFVALKERQIQENEKKYGKELRDKYGNDVMDAANERLKQMDETIFQSTKRLEKEILHQLEKAFQTGDPSGEEAKILAQMHKIWICRYWDTYTKKAHAGLAQTYVDDIRMKKYYDPDDRGLAKFLRDAIWIDTGMEEKVLPFDEKKK
ncbi:MAG TPA: MerR family transcriptional regulator [Firmicutes bacterium]|nr:MerR family transcriptional regulator [Bacillales bacterium]HJA40537.1 MerR family transcriptional regulator [Bacillota bacterium]